MNASILSTTKPSGVTWFPVELNLSNFNFTKEFNLSFFFYVLAQVIVLCVFCFFSFSFFMLLYLAHL
jgi:hypothetical protein